MLAALPPRIVKNVVGSHLGRKRLIRSAFKEPRTALGLHTSVIVGHPGRPGLGPTYPGAGAGDPGLAGSAQAPARA